LYCELRRAEMCGGGEAGPDECPEALEVQCAFCGRVWTSPDVYNPGRCPGCQKIGFTVLRCDSCPLDDLEEARQNSRAGRLVGRLLDLEFDVERFGIGWDEVTAEEAAGLRALKQERERYLEEQRKAAERENRRPRRNTNERG
jgi:hypothetical protein